MKKKGNEKTERLNERGREKKWRRKKGARGEGDIGLNTCRVIDLAIRIPADAVGKVETFAL